MKGPNPVGDWLWEPDVPPSQYEADPASLTMVPECPGEPGAWVNSLADYRRGFWNNSAKPARKLRVNSGIFTGSNGVRYLGATAGNNGQTEFWVHKVSSDVQATGARWWISNAANIFERDNGNINVSIVTRSAANGPAGTIGLISSVVGRNASAKGGVWGIYGDAISEVGHVGNMRCGEFNVVNKAGAITTPETPYSPQHYGPGLHYVFGIAAGGDVTIHGSTYDVDEAIRFNSNGSRFHSGLLFRSNALVLDGSAEGRMIRAAKGHALTWDAPNGSESARIVSTGTNAGVAWRMSMNDADTSFEADGNLALRLIPATDMEACTLQVGNIALSARDIRSNRRIALKDGAGNTVYLLATTVAP